MAHSPIFRPAVTAQKVEGATVPKWAESEAFSQLAKWQSILATLGGGAASADLALDLVLNEIVEGARAATDADAAAIALAREGEIVCRATTGEGAPDLGTRLNTSSGLTGASVQTGTWQRCDDSENDPRVDAGLCRELGVRCMLVMPVLEGSTVLGVIEIFSARAGAFGESEVNALHGLAVKIVENIELARRTLTRSKDAREEDDGPREVNPAFAGSESSRSADLWTGALMAAVVVLAVILGWMVGRGQRLGSRASGERAAVTNSPVDVEARKSPETPKTPPVSSPKTGVPATSATGTLVVYQDGKMVFPAAKNARASQSSPADVAPAVERSKVEDTGPVRVSPEVAAGYVTSRVEPEYPNHAREGRIQGAVTLDTVIGRDGAVRRFASIHGDPELASAASAAVRQWRFRPLVENGEAREFQTQITVVFRLPR